MRCVSAYEYVVGEATMTKIFAVYRQEPLVSQVSRRKMLSHAAVNSFSDMSLSYSYPDVDLVAFIV